MAGKSPFVKLILAGLCGWLAAGGMAAPASAAADLERRSAVVELPGGKSLTYFVSVPDDPARVSAVLIGIQGYTRDANRTFDAAAKAAFEAGHEQDTLIAAPVFQVPADDAPACHFRDMPAPGPQDALWRCGSWPDGSPALNDRKVTSFSAVDALIGQLVRQYPQLRMVTLAGFSAGGQFVQRYAAFGSPPGSVKIRYVVADPSSFVYFDSFRPVMGVAACPGYNDWKYGLDALPAWLGRPAMAARARYAAADLQYLEGALDTGDTRKAGRDLLATGCQAELQGRYRLDRGENYAAYDARMLAHGRHSLTIIPGCGHNVACVFPNPVAGGALFGGR